MANTVMFGLVNDHCGLEPAIFNCSSKLMAGMGALKLCSRRSSVDAQGAVSISTLFNAVIHVRQLSEGK